MVGCRPATVRTRLHRARKQLKLDLEDLTMKNNWNELKDIKAPQELKERTLAAAREARKLTNEPLHAVPRIRGEWQSAFWRQPAHSVLCWAARLCIARIMAPRRPAVQP